MFRPLREFDITEVFKPFIFGHVAYDPDTGLSIWRSKGRRRAGRPARYGIHGHTTSLYVPRPCFTAYDDDEAIDKGNRWLAAHLCPWPRRDGAKALRLP